ncbi:unnamed protein product [Cylicocyclus nassatus]|uniref:Uncharacterized protein n=1 Tax=Cylicocyclus nassatus TaxID=53992 RepID=A0AA36M162_CYLNA|nr:unnamed protein product [Cylicocyclus nassatus]
MLMFLTMRSQELGSPPLDDDDPFVQQRDREEMEPDTSGDYANSSPAGMQCALSAAGDDDTVEVLSVHSKHDENSSNVVDQQPTSSSKCLSIPKLHSLIKMRQKLLKQLRKLEVREVCFDDEAKELFYINHERKLKKTLVDVERTLLKHGALLDVDEEVRALHDAAHAPSITVADTGNELLNKRITDLMNKKIANKEKIVTPSFDELRDLMCELRTECGPSSGIPDPEKELDAFLDHLDNIAFVTIRTHQNFISSQFLENVDLYVPEDDRPTVRKLPELSSPMKELSSTEGDVLPDEVFRMELQTAGRLELDNPSKDVPDEEVDLLLDEDSGSDRDLTNVDEQLSEEEDDGSDKDVVDEDDHQLDQDHDSDNKATALFSPNHNTLAEVLEASPQVVANGESSTFESDICYENPESYASVSSAIPMEERLTVTLNLSQPSQTAVNDSACDKDVIKRVSEWLHDIKEQQVTVTVLENNLEEVEEKKCPKREINTNECCNDDDEIECLGVFKGSADQNNISRSKRPRLDKVGNSAGLSTTEIETIYIDD